MVRVCSRINVVCPGSIMLMGEHSVLMGHRAIACAISKNIHLTLTPRKDDVITIDSQIGEYQSRMREIKPEEPFEFVLQTVQEFRHQLVNGFDLRIESAFSHQLGLGSSAAVTAALVTAIQCLIEVDFDRHVIFDKAFSIIRKVQGTGSGTDVAASVFGGTVGYTATPKAIVNVPNPPALRLYYCGYKTKTPIVIQQVAKRMSGQAEVLKELYQLMNSVTLSAEKALVDENWTEFGVLVNVYHGLLDSIGVSDERLSHMVYTLRSSNVLGSKISGAGLGDCVLSIGGDILADIGGDESNAMDAEEIPVSISKQGIEVSFE